MIRFVDTPLYLFCEASEGRIEGVSCSEATEEEEEERRMETSFEGLLGDIDSRRRRTSSWSDPGASNRMMAGLAQQHHEE